MSEDVREDNERRGAARHLGTTFEIGPDTRLRVSMPYLAKSSTGEPLPIPFVLQLGPSGLSVHIERADLERLHALIGRALDPPTA